MGSIKNPDEDSTSDSNKRTAWLAAAGLVAAGAIVGAHHLVHDDEADREPAHGSETRVDRETNKRPTLDDAIAGFCGKFTESLQERTGAGLGYESLLQSFRETLPGYDENSELVQKFKRALLTYDAYDEALELSRLLSVDKPIFTVDETYGKKVYRGGLEIARLRNLDSATQTIDIEVEVRLGVEFFVLRVKSVPVGRVSAFLLERIQAYEDYLAARERIILLQEVSHGEQYLDGMDSLLARYGEVDY